MFRRFHALVATLAAAAIVIASPCSEAQVEWAVDADGVWHDASNWSSNPALPGATDDVQIDRPAGTFTVTHSQGSSSIQSLVSQESLSLTGGTLTIGAGGGSLNGALTVGGASATHATAANPTSTAAERPLLPGPAPGEAWRVGAQHRQFLVRMQYMG